MIKFLPENTWKNKRGFYFKKPVNYLKVGYHTGQDFFTNPAGSIPVIAPCAGSLITFPFSKSAGWWGYYKFEHDGKIYSLRILHMYDQMKDGEYKEGDTLGYCGATGLSKSPEYGICYIGESHEEQASDKAVPHLHVELHKGELQHDTNHNKALADERLIDPVTNFENWITEKSSKSIVTERNEVKKIMPKKQQSFIKQDEVKQNKFKVKREANESIWNIIQKAVVNWLKSRK